MGDGVGLLPGVHGKGELVVVNGEELLWLEVEYHFLQVVGRCMDVSPVVVILTVLKESEVNRAEAVIDLAEMLAVSAVTAYIDLTMTVIDEERSPKSLIALA